MISTLTVATLTALCIVLIAIAWRQHDQITRLRIDAQTANDWSDYWQHKTTVREQERDALQRNYDNVHTLYCALVRRRLAETYPLIERNLHRN